MCSSNGGGSAIKSFALVSYLPDPLGAYLDRLRGELVQECRAKAHVTVLPPRPLACGSEDAWFNLELRLHDFQPFLIELGEVEIFPVTQVVYLAVKTGSAKLRELHAKLNVAQFAFQEPFVYHPHVTLAQDLEASRVAGAYETAAARWKQFAHSRSFVVDHLTFVQNTRENRWTDLHGCPLRSSVTI